MNSQEEQLLEQIERMKAAPSFPLKKSKPPPNPSIDPVFQILLEHDRRPKHCVALLDDANVARCNKCGEIWNLSEEQANSVWDRLEYCNCEDISEVIPYVEVIVTLSKPENAKRFGDYFLRCVTCHRMVPKEEVRIHSLAFSSNYKQEVLVQISYNPLRDHIKIAPIVVRMTLAR